MIDKNKSMRWMTNNFLEVGVSSIQTSSENPNFPKSNLYGKDRNKPFKFNGRFLIEEDVNDKIYINGDTWVIDSGDYRSFDDLLSAPISGPSSLSLFRDGDTNTFGLVFSSGSFTLNLSNRNESAWDTLGFTNTVDLEVLGNTVFANESRVHWPYDYLKFDIGYQAPVGFIGMVSSIAEEFTIPAGAIVRVQGNNVDSFISPPLDMAIPWYKTGMFKFIDDIEDSVFRFIKIIIQCPNSSIIPEIGYLYIGDYETGGNRNISTGFELSYVDLSVLSSSDGGVVYDNPKPSYRVYSALNIELTRQDQAAFLKDIWRRKKRNNPFFIALDPTSYLSFTPDEHIAFVTFEDSPKFLHILRNIFSLSFSLKEVV